MIKYDSDGNLLWTQTYNGPGNGTDSMDYTYIRVDSNDNVVQTGLSYGGPASGFDVVTLKYSPLGTQLWERRFDGIENGFDAGWGVQIGSDDSIYVAGDTTHAATGSDFLALKYDPSGNLLWQTSHDIPGSTAETTCTASCRSPSSRSQNGWAETFVRVSGR